MTGQKSSPDMPESLDVFIVHWEKPDWCLSAVHSIAQSDVPVSITVINNSPALGQTLLDSSLVPISLITTSGNIGYASAANIGLAEWLRGTSEFAVIGSHDLHVDSNAIRLMLAAIRSDDRLGIVGPILTDKVSGANSIDSHNPDESGTSEAAWLSGTCLLVRRACIEQIGGFDRVFHSYVEDVDLCWRAIAAGWKLGLVKGARARGLGSGDAVASYKLATRNSLRLRYIHHGTKGFLRSYLAQIILVVKMAIKCLSPHQTHIERTRQIRNTLARGVGLLPRRVLFARPRTDLVGYEYTTERPIAGLTSGRVRDNLGA